MEFNVFEYFKRYKRTTPGPRTPEEQGTSFFLAGHMGERISEHVDVYAAKAGMSRRNFLGTASGFAAAMLAVNQITGMAAANPEAVPRKLRRDIPALAA